MRELTLPGGEKLVGPEKLRPAFQDLGSFLSQLYIIGLYVAIFLAFFWLVWGVFEYIAAGGDKQKLATARGRITWALVGIVMIILAYLVSQYAAQILLPDPTQQQKIPIL